MIAIGVDIGGTSIKGAAITNKGEVLDIFSLPINKNEDQLVTVNRLAETIKNYLKEHSYTKDNVLGVGFGIPGCIDTKNGVVSYSNNLNWNELPFVQIMKEQLGLPIRITNDANAAAYAEAKFGAGKKYQNILMVTLGTGVGGGIVLNGQLYEGNEGKGAELGHTVVVIDGEQCSCGRKGCLEAYASATALIRDTKRMMDLHKDSLLWKVKDELGIVDARAAFIAEKNGDPYGKILVDNYVKYLGEGLLNYFNIFRPEAVVLSGGVANEGDNLTSRLIKYCEDRHYGFNRTPKVEILTSELGYHSGKIGAAALFFTFDK